MSNYVQMTKHPETGKWHYAAWIDDYYGRHCYGVIFPDGKWFDPMLVQLKTKRRYGGLEKLTRLFKEVHNETNK